MCVELDSCCAFVCLCQSSLIGKWSLRPARLAALHRARSDGDRDAEGEAHAEALESGADPAWLVPPPDEPNWRWNGIVSADAEAGAEYVAF